MLEGFGLLCGHLLGDYIIQNDWMARYKTVSKSNPQDLHLDWADYTGHLACTIHCLLYTLAVWLCSFQWMSWWGLLACFGLHWCIDRYRLAKKWMEHVSGQKDFANGPLSPWSVIVVDNTFHLLTLYLIAIVIHFS